MKFRLQCPSVKFSWNSPPPIPSHAAWGSLGAQKLHQEPHGPQSLRYLLTGSLQRKFATHSLGWENLGCGETEPRRGSRRLGPEQSGVYTNKACFLLGSKGPPQSSFLRTVEGVTDPGRAASSPLALAASRAKLSAKRVWAKRGTGDQQPRARAGTKSRGRRATVVSGLRESSPTVRKESDLEMMCPFFG